MKRYEQGQQHSAARRRWLLVGYAGVIFSASSLHAQVTQQWVAHYNGPGNYTDAAIAMAVDGSGNVYVTGYSVGATKFDYATVAYDSNGNQSWVARYNGGDEPRGMAINRACGNIYVTGRGHRSLTDDDYATVAYDSSGNQLWAARYIGPGNTTDEAQAIAVDEGTGNVYVTGTSYGGGATGFNYATVAYNSRGSQLWVARSNGYDDFAMAIAVDRVSGNIYVTGNSAIGDSTRRGFATVAYDSRGNQLWVARSNGPAEYATAIAVDQVSGNIYVTGYGYGDPATAYEYATMAYDSRGNQLWVARYHRPGPYRGLPDVATAIAVDGISNVYVTGYSDGGAGTGYDYATVAYDAGGTQLWAARYNGPGNSTDVATAVATDGTGNLYVTGYSRGNAAAGDNYATVAYGSRGNQLWVARTHGPGDYAHAIATDGMGNIYVTGTGYGGVETDYDYLTIKYSQP